MDVTQPQNDREFLIQLSAHMDKLSDSIDNLSTVVMNVEVKRIAPLEIRIAEFLKWKSEMNGVWKAVLALSVLLSITSFIIAIAHFYR